MLLKCENIVLRPETIDVKKINKPFLYTDFEQCPNAGKNRGAIPNRHIGGDIYQKNSNIDTLYLVFNWIGQGNVIQHEVCDWSYQEKCYNNVHSTLRTMPMYFLYGISESSGLTEQSIKDLGLLKSNVYSFPLDYCD